MLKSCIWPLFLTVISYLIISPAPTSPSPLSTTVAIFVASKDFVIATLVSVGSSSVFPSLSMPSSLVSETLFVWPGLFAITVSEFDTEPVLAAAACIW